MDQAFIAACNATIAKLKPLLPDAASQMEKLLAYFGVQAQRLAAGATREAALKAQADQVPALQKQIDAMLDHPDVKAKRLQTLNDQIAALQKQRDSLATPTPTTPTTSPTPTA